MTTFEGVKTRPGWGVLDESGFRIVDSPYDALGPGKVPFAACQIAGSVIAIVVEYPRTPELHARLAAAPRPSWIDAVGQATRTSPADAIVAEIQADLVAPADFDRSAFALASAVVLYSYGMFDRVPERYDVCVADQLFSFTMEFDDDTEAWSADVVPRR